MHQVFVRASFTDLKPRPKALVPTLDMQIELILSKRSGGETLNVPDDTNAIIVHSIQGFLFWSTPGDDDWTRGYMGVGFPGPLYYPEGLREDEKPTQECTVAFPLSHNLVSRIEDLRAGGDARMRAFFRIDGYTTTTLRQFIPPRGHKADEPVDYSMLSESLRADQAAIPFHVNRLHLSDSRGQTQEIVIPKSRWVEDVLPGLGWSASKIVEIPLLGLGTELREADELLGDAENRFYLGDWAGSLTATRRTVEALEPIIKENMNPAHTWKETSAADKASDLVDRHIAWAKATLEYQSAVRAILHAGAHKPIPGATLERADAELGLMLALGLRRYVGLRMSAKPT